MSTGARPPAPTAPTATPTAAPAPATSAEARTRRVPLRAAFRPPPGRTVCPRVAAGRMAAARVPPRGQNQRVDADEVEALVGRYRAAIEAAVPRSSVHLSGSTLVGGFGGHDI